MRGVKGSGAAEFWGRLGGEGSVEECWPWRGPHMTKGYGVHSRVEGERLAHRIAWRLLRGEIPDGLVLDHLCHNAACCNPWHLEVVTQSENARRGSARSGHVARFQRAKTHCPQGHPYSESNTRPAGVDGRGRGCRECHRIRQRAYYARKRGQ